MVTVGLKIETLLCVECGCARQSTAASTDLMAATSLGARAKTFLPSCVLAHISKSQNSGLFNPSSHELEAAVMYIELGGLPRLCQVLTRKGPSGVEQLSTNMDKFLEPLFNTIHEAGGDIVKFAFDSMLVLWPTDSAQNVPMSTLLHRAAQCALDLCHALQNKLLYQDIYSSSHMTVKIGLGSGRVAMIQLGGVYSRLEYVFVGSAIAQAVQASGAAAFGECLMSQSAWDLVKASQSLESSAAADSAANCVKLDCVTKRADHVTETATVNPDEKTLKQIQNVMAPVITPWLELNNDEWTGELRQVTVLAVNIPFKSSKLTVISEGVFEKLQAIISAVQTSVYHYEGSVTSSIVDERGINIQLTFGLPSTVHENDPSRGLLCALKLKQMLLPQKINATIGVATGAAFCGIIGTDRRREFAVLGETSNLATHLMQSTSAIGILCDRATHNASMSEKRLSFESVGDIKFSMSSNSKTGLIPAFVPSYVQHAGNLLTIPPRVLVSIGRDSEISILLDCVRAAASGEGGRVVLIDGDVGVGKSHLMQHVWTKCQSEKTLDALWSSGDNFSMLKSFYVWKQMFASILRTFSPDERPEDRQEWFAAHIKADYPDLVPHLSLCNELLQVEFESPQTPSNFMSGEPMSLAHLPRRRSTLMINPPALDDSIDSSNAQRQAQKLLPLGAHSAEYEAEQAKMARSYDLTAKLCVAYLKKMFTSIVAETPLPAATYSDTTSTAQKATPHARSGLVMFFDRAQHMSASDWILLDRVCALVRDRSLRRLTVVVGCRSQYKKYMAPSAAEAVPTEYYDRLRKQHATDTLALKPLSAASTAQMVAYVVNGQWGVNSTLVHERTGGTPLFIQKILAALRDVGVFDAASGTFVPVSSTGAPSAADAARAPPATQHIDWTSELPIPFGVQRIAAARFDRLTLSQQFVLRVAAVLCVGAGRGCIEFDVEAIRQSLPMPEFAAKLDADIAELMSMEYITRSEPETYKRRVSLSTSAFNEMSAAPTPVKVEPLPAPQSDAGGGLARSGTMMMGTFRRQSTSHAASLNPLPQDTGKDAKPALMDMPMAPQTPLHRFSFGFLRDTLYHLMLYSQRQYMHDLVARKLDKQIKNTPTARLIEGYQRHLALSRYDGELDHDTLAASEQLQQSSTFTTGSSGHVIVPAAQLSAKTLRGMSSSSVERVPTANSTMGYADQGPAFQPRKQPTKSSMFACCGAPSENASSAPVDLRIVPTDS